MWTATLILWFAMAAVTVVWFVAIVKDAQEEPDDVVELGEPKNEGPLALRGDVTDGVASGLSDGLAHNSNKSELGNE